MATGAFHKHQNPGSEGGKVPSNVEVPNFIPGFKGNQPCFVLKYLRTELPFRLYR
jgi:hypothetical protein